jgi:hypothetical protein
VIALYSRYEQNTTKYTTNIEFYTQYTHPMLICRGTDTQTDARTNARMDNIYSIFRDKLLLLGEHVHILSTLLENNPVYILRLFAG